MTKNFAIKGHPTRGKEVIKILEMLGGKSAIPIDIIRGDYAYVINEKGSILPIPRCNIDFYNCIIFTLEEFITKFPYKVGDKVKLYYQDEENDRYCSAIPSTIIGMRWDKSHGVVAYKMKDIDREFYKQEFTYNKDKNNEPDAVIAGINLNRTDYADEVEINLGDYEIEVRNGRTFAVLKKPKYPITYEECWKVRFEVDGETTLEEFHNVSGYYSEPLGALQKLLCCRDAYWNIAGEEMCLDGPWEPDWNEANDCIINWNGEIKCEPIVCKNVILAFPNEEMRDAFYKNFKDLIEKCKELL